MQTIVDVMINLDEIPDDVLFARGKYSTLNAALKDETHALQLLASELMGSASSVMKSGQNGDLKSAYYALVVAAHAIAGMRTICETIEGLQDGKTQLKPLAWPVTKKEKS